MFSQLDNIVIAFIIALTVLLIFAFGTIGYICSAILSATQQTLNNIKSSQTSQEQYMYMMRGSIDNINNDLTHFFVVNGYENMMSIRRKEELQRERSRDPPTAGYIG